jgi:hypothetical protein
MARVDTYQQWVRDGEVDEKLALMQSLSMQGFSISVIAQIVGIGARTLHRFIKDYPAVSSAISTGRLSVVAVLQQRLIDKAIEGDTTAIIYGLKIYGGEFFNDRSLKIRAEITTEINVSPSPIIYIPQKNGSEDD